MSLYKGFAGILILAPLAGIAGGWGAFGAVIGVAALLFLGWLFTQYVWIRVPEMETAVIFNIETKAFSRFLGPGRHLLLFPVERAQDAISTAPASVKGICASTQTCGGIEITVNWMLTYRINPLAINREWAPMLARALPQYANRLLRSHANNCIAHWISRHPVGELYDNGARGRFERQLRENLRERLAPFGFQVYRFMATGVEFPSQVQAALEAAHEREVYAYSEARMLERLQQAISRFSNEDMARLLQLGQLRELGQNGIALQTPVMTMVSGQSVFKPRDKDRGQNGRVKDGPAVSPPPSPPEGQSEWPSLH